MIKNTVKLNDNIYIDCYNIDENSSNPCLIICPGGGYGYHSPREAEPVALKFLSKGLNSCVLYYSVADKAKFPRPLIDLSETIKFLKSDDSPICNNKKIITIGFSAGANLVLEYNAKWKEISNKYVNCNYELKPFLTICGYPPVSFEDDSFDAVDESFANEIFYFKNSQHIKEIAEDEKRQLCEGISYAVFGKQKPSKKEMDEYNLLVSSDFYNMSPVFIFSTLEDKIINNNDILKLAMKFNENKVPYELHMFQWGEHGLSLGDAFTATNKAQIDMHYSKWFDMSIEWIFRQLKQEI